MKDILNFDLSELLVVIIILLGLVLFFLLKFIRYNVMTYKFGKNHKKYFTILETGSWLFFGGWSLKMIFGGSEYYSIFTITIFAIFSLWIGWFLVKDFIAGIILKLSDSYQKGQFFRLGKIKGNITEINYLHLTINKNNGEIVKIPFSKILGSVHHKSFLDDKTKKGKFSFSIERQDSLVKTTDKIREIILLTAGVNIKKEPIINLIDDSEKIWQFEITFFVLDDKYCETIESNVIKAFR